MKGAGMDRYPVINRYKTGQNLRWIMEFRGLFVRDVQKYLGLATPQSIYHWFEGRNMPTVDNLYALSELFRVPVDTMLCGNRRTDFRYHASESFGRLYAYYDALLKRKAG